MADQLPRMFFVPHIGIVTVTSGGTVTFEANVQTPVGLTVRKGQEARVIVNVDTLRDIMRGVRTAMREMASESRPIPSGETNAK